MRFLVLVALIGLFLSMVDASAASADQCPARESRIVTDRPDVTNSSLVVPEGSFQSENGINFSQRGGSHEFDGTESRLRWGVVPCLEVLVDLPTYLAAVRGSLNSGFTNVIPAIKWQISAVPGKIDLSTTFGAGLPIGSKMLAQSLQAAALLARRRPARARTSLALRNHFLVLLAQPGA